MSEVVWAATNQVSSGSAAAGGIIVLIYLAVIVLEIAALWTVFSKAGQRGWKAIIPVLNILVLLKIIGRPWWWIILLLIPFVNIVFGIIIAIDLAKSFGKTGGFAVGLVLLSFVFYPILGFGSARYLGPAGRAAGGRAAGRVIEMRGAGAMDRDRTLPSTPSSTGPVAPVVGCDRRSHPIGTGARRAIGALACLPVVALLVCSPLLASSAMATTLGPHPQGGATGQLVATTSASVVTTTTTTTVPTTTTTTTTTVPTTTTTSSVPTSTSTSTSTTTTTAPKATTTTTLHPATPAKGSGGLSSTAVALIVAAVVLVALIILLAILLSRRSKRLAAGTWRRSVQPALDDARLARETLLSANAVSEDAQLRGAVDVQVDRAARALEHAGQRAPDEAAQQITGSVANSLRGLAFAVEADRLLRHGAAAPSGMQLAQADEARRSRLAELDSALARLAAHLGTMAPDRHAG